LRSFWIYENTEVSPAPRTVDITDFTKFLIGFKGSGLTWEVGNFNGDNDVDITDFVLFLGPLTSTGGGIYGPSQSIPEPSNVLLLVFGALSGLVIWWRIGR